jgi:HlyD family secretion protein
MKRKPLLIAGGVLLVAAIIVANVLREFERAESVEVEQVRRRDLRAVVSASGWLKPLRQIDVSANTMGKVVELGITEGDRVERGQLLLRIDPVRYRGEVEQMVASLRAARAEAEAAEASLAESVDDLEREETLAERGLSSRGRLDSARREVERARATVAARRAEVGRRQAALDTAEHELDQVTVTSELTGIITRLDVEVGENVVTGTMNNPGTVLMTIADLSEMEVRLEVDETDVVHLRHGQPAQVTIDAFPDTLFDGHVSKIGHAPIRQAGRAGETTADFEVMVRLDATIDDFRPGLSASAEIVTATRDDVPSVSIGALVYRDPERERRAAARHGRAAGGDREPGDRGDREPGDGAVPADSASGSRDAPADGPGSVGSRQVYGLFVIEEGRARFRPVELGITGERQFEIVSGVDPGTEVIAGPFQILRSLESGTRVKPGEGDATPEDADDGGSEAGGAVASGRA